MKRYMTQRIKVCGKELTVAKWDDSVPVSFGVDDSDYMKRKTKWQIEEKEINEQIYGIKQEIGGYLDGVSNLDELYEKYNDLLDARESFRAEREQYIEYVILQNAKRRKQKVMDLVDCNWRKYSKMLTLTFQDNITDLDIAHKIFGNFIKLLKKYMVSEKLSYLAVIERQKRGAVHYHVCIFNNTYFPRKDLLDIWQSVGGGYQLDIRAKQDLRDKEGKKIINVGSYIAKYMGKDLVEGEEVASPNRKRYFTSKGLKKPVVVCDNVYNNNNFMKLVRHYAQLVYIGDVFENEDLYVKSYQVSKYRFKNLKLRSEFLEKCNDLIKATDEIMGF